MTTPADAAMQLRAERAPFVMLPRWLLYHPDVSEGATSSTASSTTWSPDGRARPGR